MDLCRVCLTGRSHKDILQLQSTGKESNKSFVDVFMFCLDIQVEQDSKISTKLCIKCYKKVLSFHEFKCLALKNDAYLKSLQEDGVKNEVFLTDDIKCEQQFTLSDESQEIAVKNEPKDDLYIKNEDEALDNDTDDEFLSVIKNIKYEYIETKEKAPSKKKLKKGKAIPKIEHNGMKMCEECGKTVKDLKSHAFSHMPEATRKRIKCKSCDKVFSSHSARHKHNKIKHLGIKQQCPVCHKMVISLKQHNRIVHDRDTLPFECVSCGGRFISKSTLEIHMMRHTKDKPHACPVCDKKFITKPNMLLHKRSVHDKEKTHLCQLCSKSFFKKYHLQVHLRSHTKEKPYACSECGKCFSTTTILKSHMLIHEEMKNFACTLCDMTFKKQSYLKIHMIHHTKVKKYPCQYCGIKFGRSDHRKRHEFTAHEKHFIST